MRHGSSNRRQRSRNTGRRSGGNQRSQVFDSNGPEVRIRGTAHQVVEKYEALAKDSKSAGDLVLAESYLQHAEHYIRVIGSWGEDVQSSNKAQTDQLDQRDGSAGNNVQSQKSKPKSKPKPKEDDLGLPVSILGETSDEKSEVQGEDVSA